MASVAQFLRGPLLNYLLVMSRSLKAEEPTNHHLNPVKLLHCVERVMSKDAIIVADGGDFVGTAAYILR